eukprot:scaffold54_cov110-Cylindrotheca_fusiformis.AAC.1
MKFLIRTDTSMTLWMHKLNGLAYSMGSGSILNSYHFHSKQQSLGLVIPGGCSEKNSEIVLLDGEWVRNDAEFQGLPPACWTEERTLNEGRARFP